MKDRILIFIMLLIFLSLLGKLFISGEKKEQSKPAAKNVVYESLDELAIFVTLENEIAANELGITYSGDRNIWAKDIRASILVSDSSKDTKNATADSDVKREPDYISMYPNLYATPQTEWEEVKEGQKTCFLTFDDGPSAYTKKVLDVLDEKGIKATFFVIGEEIALSKENEEILKEISDRGHIIALHTYCHDYGTIYKSVSAFLADYEKVFNLIEEITGQRPYIYRFPGGSYNKYMRRMRKELILEMERRGFIFYDWNVSAEDAVGNPTSYSIHKNISKDLARYQTPVILMHDGQTNKVTSQALSSVIEMIKKKGYNFDTLDHRKPCQFKW